MCSFINFIFFRSVFSLGHWTVVTILDITVFLYKISYQLFCFVSDDILWLCGTFTGSCGILQCFCSILQLSEYPEIKIVATSNHHVQSEFDKMTSVQLCTFVKYGYGLGHGQWCSSRFLSLGLEMSQNSILASWPSWVSVIMHPSSFGLVLDPSLGSKEELGGVADGSIINSRNSSRANARHGTTS